MKKIFLLVICLPVIGYAQQPGELDSTFAVNGLSVQQAYGDVKDMAIQGDGKILAVALPYATTGINTKIVRLHSNGEIDTSFATNGEYAIPWLEHILVQSDGKILCLTSMNNLGSVSRLLPDGTLDAGYVAPPLTMRMTSAELYTDDRLIIGGQYGSGRRLYRLVPDGSLDMSFGTLGSITINLNTGDYREEIPSIRIASNGDCYYVTTRRGPIMSNFPTTTSSIIKMEYISGNSYLLHSMVNNSICPRTLILDMNDCLLYTLNICNSGIQNVSGSIATNVWTYADIPMPPWPNGSGSIGISDVDQNGIVFIPNPENGKFSICGVSACSGTLSSLWGQNGFIQTAFPGYGSASASVVKTLEDGKLLVGGGVGFPRYFALARYHNIPDPRSKIHVKMFLGGPYDPGTGLMFDNLRQNGLIPFVQPYTPPAFQPENGIGPWGLGAGLIEQDGDSAIVDWVWLELLDPDSLTHVKATRVGLLHRNGQVTQADGISPIDFSVGAGSYFLRVRHRNHLSVTLADPVTLGLDPIAVDLTSPSTATFGTDAQKELNGVMMLWPGDVTANGEVKYIGAGNDRDPILISIGGSIPTAMITGYHREDVNLDGVVKYVGTGNDRDLILQTIGGAVPTAVRLEQGP